MNLTLSLFPFGWQHYLLGGLLIGSAVALLFVFTGLIGGMSTVFSSTWSFVVQRPFFQQARFTDSRGWRLVYALGLILGALVWWLGFADGAPQSTSIPVWQLLAGGFLVGYGARLGNGCNPLGYGYIHPISKREKTIGNQHRARQTTSGCLRAGHYFLINAFLGIVAKGRLLQFVNGQAQLLKREAIGIFCVGFMNC